jgi:hypothetical protein
MSINSTGHDSCVTPMHSKAAQIRGGYTGLRRRPRMAPRYRGSGIVAVDEGFSGLAYHCELSAAESVDRTIEAEQAISRHEPTARGRDAVLEQ